jgi:4-amino-4-deoxy-L-arabinose transferase-like glycosyltransferase
MQVIVQNKRFLYLVIGIIVLNLFINNWSISFWDQDESAYAGFAHNMRKTSNWVVPEFEWSEPHRKTPLHFWAIAGSFWLFGENEFATRFSSVLALLLAGYMLFALGKNLFGRETSLLAAILMLSSLFLPSLAKIGVTDATLMFFETGAALALLNFMHRPAWKWTLLLWLMVSGGIMVKGPPVLILVFGMMGMLFIFHPKRWRLVHLHPWIFVPLTLVPLYIWGRAAWQADGGKFITWLIDWYILKRVSGNVFGQTGPPGYFLFVFCIAFLPWLMYFPKGLGDLFSRWRKKKNEDYYWYMLAWLSAGWFVYELVSSKLPSYALGAYPAVAVIIARQILQVKAEDFAQLKVLRVSLYIYLVLALIISAGLVVAGILFLDTLGIVAAVTLALLWGGASIYNFKNYKSGAINQGLKGSLISALGFFLLAWGFIVPSLDKSRSATRQVAQLVEQTTPAHTKVVLTQKFLPSMLFYTISIDRPYQTLSPYDHLKGEHFLQLKEMYEAKTPVALVLNEEMYMQFRAFMHQRFCYYCPYSYKNPATYQYYMNLSDKVFTKVRSIDGFITDKTRPERYWVIYNQEFK